MHKIAAQFGKITIIVVFYVGNCGIGQLNPVEK
jgi:hypothetical protein